MPNEQFDPPCLFDQRGVFMPQSDAVICTWPEHVIQLYQRVSDYYTAAEVVERKTERTTKELHETVAELREVESRLARYGRVSAVDAARRWINSQREFG